MPTCQVNQIHYVSMRRLIRQQGPIGKAINHNNYSSPQMCKGHQPMRRYNREYEAANVIGNMSHHYLMVLNYQFYLCHLISDKEARPNSVLHHHASISISMLVAVFTPLQIIQSSDTAINKARSEAKARWVRKKGFVLSFMTVVSELHICIFQH